MNWYTASDAAPGPNHSSSTGISSYSTALGKGLHTRLPRRHLVTASVQLMAVILGLKDKHTRCTARLFSQFPPSWHWDGGCTCLNITTPSLRLCCTASYKRVMSFKAVDTNLFLKSSVITHGAILHVRHVSETIKPIFLLYQCVLQTLVMANQLGHSMKYTSWV